jgi:hypothetical protein
MSVACAENDVCDFMTALKLSPPEASAVLELRQERTGTPFPPGTPPPAMPLCWTGKTRSAAAAGEDDAAGVGALCVGAPDLAKVLWRLKS